MQLFHTSPEETINAHAAGMFDEFLFFSSEVYTMTAGESFVHRIEIGKEAIIDAGSLWYHDDYEKAMPFVEELMSTLGLDEDDAMALLDESKQIEDLDTDIEPEDMGEHGWNVQRLTARCAKAMGYVGVVVEDEQGSAYMIDAGAVTLERA